ncbi:transcription factor S [Candidatus Bathyarchaeota archaeon]|nr:transcription factor S [Candidatus Bathyarchaeota archaeon]
MIFCPTCGTRLVLVKKQEMNTAMEYQCRKCGYSDSCLPGIHDHVIAKSNATEEVVVVFDKELELSTMPMIKAECPKCHNNLAYVWQVQTRSGDEGSTQFFRCTKCSQTWRLYT